MVAKILTNELAAKIHLWRVIPRMHRSFRAAIHHACGRFSHLLTASHTYVGREILKRPPQVHVCVCGLPRSGTSLMYNLLCSALPTFACEEEETSSADSLRRSGDHLSKVPQDALVYRDVIAANVRKKRLIFIVMIRDLRDVITSRHAQVPDRYFIGYDSSLQISGRWPNYDIGEQALGIRDYAASIARMGQDSSIEAVYIKYEELVGDPDRVQAKIQQQFSLPFSCTFSSLDSQSRTRGLKYDGKHKPIDSSLVKINEKIKKNYIGRWADSQHHDRMRLQFRSHRELFQLLRCYGYEEDNGWFERWLAQDE